MDSEKGNRVFARGGGGQCAPPPLVFGAQKKPGWDRVKCNLKQNLQGWKDLVPWVRFEDKVGVLVWMFRKEKHIQFF